RDRGAGAGRHGPALALTCPRQRRHRAPHALARGEEGMTEHYGSPDVNPQDAVAPIGEEQPSVAVRRGMFGVTGSGATAGFGGRGRAAAPKSSTPPPYGSYYDEVAAEMERAFPDFGDAIERVVVDRGQITFHVKADRILDLCRTLRDDAQLRFELCSSVSGV